MKQTGGLILIASLALTAGCARTGITLLPGEKGEAGAVAVIDPETGSDVALIDSPNTKGGIGNGRKLAMKAVSSQELDRRYGSLLSEMPEPPRLFVLYFREGSTELVDESTQLVPELFDEMKRRPGVDIQIVGHTDTVGDGELNDRLSVQRAEIVRDMLVKIGMQQDIVRATGRGERELMQPTEDNVASVFNRRVEVLVK
jgi:outer membrane protein OmpA-like peptidoglycan-associated protein